LKAAQLPPTSWVCPNLPFLSFSLRSSSLFALSFGWLGSRQPGLTQGGGIGSRIVKLIHIWFQKSFVIKSLKTALYASIVFFKKTFVLSLTSMQRVR
jgi:hypothetical protein